MDKNDDDLKSQNSRMLWRDAKKIADTLVEKLKMLKEVEKIEIAGSIRRNLETVGNINLVIAAKTISPIVKFLQKQSFIAEFVGAENNFIKIWVKQGLFVEIVVVPLKNFDSTLLYLTGSKEHNLKLLELADFNLVNELSEKEIYQALNLPFIPPVLRENKNEFLLKEVPKLIEDKDIRGIFHCHTTYSDGKNSIEEMVEEAVHLGWVYIGISDHSKSSFQAGGMDEKRLFDQIEHIRSLKLPIKVFAGLECDILKDGELDFPNDVLKHLDFVVVSLHRRFKLDEKEQTKRIIKAIENPYTTIIGHLTGRLLNHRPPAPLNVSKIIDAAIANKKIMELNGNPHRLDMDWRYWLDAREKGLICCINPDAHSTKELKNIHFAINVAQKAMIQKNEVFNTQNVKQIQKYLKR